MTSQGTARGRFQRAIHARHVQNAEIAAREMGGLSLADALSLCATTTARRAHRALNVQPPRAGSGRTRSVSGVITRASGSHPCTILGRRDRPCLLGRPNR
jgi:hypothetical protein